MLQVSAVQRNGSRRPEGLALGAGDIFPAKCARGRQCFHLDRRHTGSSDQFLHAGIRLAGDDPFGHGSADVTNVFKSEPDGSTAGAVGIGLE